MAEVVLEGVSKRYGNGVEAVRNLSLSVADGEFLVLVGPSGCGKTTTLRLLAGLETPTSGRLSIGGQVVNHLPPRQRRVAMVFQRPALYPHLSVRENLAFGLTLQSSWSWLWTPPRQALQERIDAAARLLHLEEVLDRLPDQLSGGQQQRVALGRALVRDPAVFLLDEPLSNLDARLRAEMRRELHLLHERLRATMIYVTHDQVEALTLGDRVAVLQQGVVEQVAAPRVLYERPANRFVAGFIGWPPMNFVDGELLGESGGLWLVTEPGRLPLDQDLAHAWQPYGKRALTVGIRPEDVSLQPVPERAASLRMQVELVESLGHETLVTLRRGDWRVSALWSGRERIGRGEEMMVAFDLNKAHLFDRVSGLALSHGRLAAG